MQIFYLSNTGKENSGFEKIKRFFTEYSNIPFIAGFQAKILFKNHHLSYYSKGEDFIANGGVFIYRDNFNKVAVSLFYEDLNSGDKLEDLLLKAHGQFFLVLYFRGKLMVITDRFRTIPVYLLRQGNTIEVSNTYYLLSRNNNVRYSVNFDYLAQHLSCHDHFHVFSNDTLFKEVLYLKPGSIYSFRNNEVKIETYYDINKDIRFGRYKNIEEVLDNLAGIFESNFRFLDNVENIFCGITGGFDTRMNISTLLKKNKQFLCGNEIMQHEDYLKKGRYSDLPITQKIVKEFNLDYRNICGDMESVIKWKKENEDFFKLIKTIGSYHRYYYFDSVSKIADIEVGGFAGSELYTKNYYSYFRKIKAFNVKEFIRMQRYNDVLIDKYYNRERYYAYLEEYIKNLVAPLTYSTRGDLCTYLFYSSLFMNNISDYVGSINLFCPSYTPYLEPDFIKIMLETPYTLKGFHSIQRRLYARIMDKKLRDFDTTHGYPATTLTPANFYRFLRLLYPIEPNLAYLSPIEILKRETYGFMAGMVLPHFYKGLKFLKLDRKIKLDSIDEFVHIIRDSNPINKYLDNTKMQKRRMTIRLRSMIKFFGEHIEPYLEK
ncbi:MAG: hypothetical protein Q7O04_06920 [Candidatus Omnitrophota bacterium]|nr:hypothetical protein [Candidatus Omnitrophota bacterium]